MQSYSQKVAQELEIIKSTLNQFKSGARIEEIRAASGLNMELRTLQRRMADLKNDGIVITYGEKRGIRYFLAKPTTIYLYEPEETYTSLQISDAGQEIRGVISRSVQHRKPVGYNLNFLENYQPNSDSYFTSNELARLALIGRTISQNQPAGSFAREILNRLLIDLSYNSSRLEGNTYSLLETKRLISLGKTADEKSVWDAQMILNHKDAIEFLVQGGPEIGFNRYTMLNLHALLSDNLMSDRASSGRLRKIDVGIHNSVYTPLQIPQQIELMFELILKKVQQIENPFEQAFFLMVHIPYLQPFEDVNKRVSRLAANIPLNQHNLAPLSFIDVPNDIYIQGILGVYELNRVELLKDIFLWAYERSALRYAAVRQTLREPDPFNVKYREEIKSLVTAIVSGALSQELASKKIRETAHELPAEDQGKFIEQVDTELLSLHEGNFARFRVRPAEFNRWKEIWEIE